MGDMLMSLPAIQAARLDLPEVQLTLLVREGLEPLLENHPDLDQILTWRPQGGAGWLASWRMAKRLETGQLLHGLGGSWPLEDVEELHQDQAYNLVVGDFATYFVGERGILVHDNTFRQPTTAILPGLHRHRPIERGD